MVRRLNEGAYNDSGLNQFELKIMTPGRKGQSEIRQFVDDNRDSGIFGSVGSEYGNISIWLNTDSIDDEWVDTVEDLIIYAQGYGGRISAKCNNELTNLINGINESKKRPIKKSMKESLEPDAGYIEVYNINKEKIEDDEDDLEYESIRLKRESTNKRRPTSKNKQMTGLREANEDFSVRDEFMYAFCIDKTTVFEVDYYTLGNNKAPDFSTYAAKFNRPKSDWSEGGQAQERLLPVGSPARKFFDKWDHLHLHDLTDEEYSEIRTDIEELKRAYPYYVGYEFDGKATRTRIPFYDIYKKSMEMPRTRRRK